MICGIRCDANGQIGWGHFSRCLSLANAMKKHQVEVVFLMIEPEKSICETLNNSLHKLIKLPAKLVNLDSNQDASHCLEQLSLYNIYCNIIVVDNYSLNHTWWHNFKAIGTNIMILNDSGKPPQNVDIIWDTGTEDTAYYCQLSNKPLLLLGPKHALLREEFQRNDKSSKLVVTKNNYKVLVCIGATDPLNTNKKITSCLLSLPVAVKVTLLTTSSNIHLKSIKEEYRENQHVDVIVNCNNVAKLMTNQTLIITGAGNMLWEAFSLSIPCMIVKTCDNQQRNIDLITSQMQEIYLGDERHLNERTMAQHLLYIFTYRDKLAQLSLQSYNICDGKGAERVATAIVKRIKDE